MHTPFQEECFGQARVQEVTCAALDVVMRIVFLAHVNIFFYNSYPPILKY